MPRARPAHRAGFIADPGSAIGEKYIPECEAFMQVRTSPLRSAADAKGTRTLTHPSAPSARMQSMGRAPLTHVLTPRYKVRALIERALCVCVTLSV